MEQYWLVSVDVMFGIVFWGMWVCSVPFDAILNAAGLWVGGLLVQYAWPGWLPLATMVNFIFVALMGQIWLRSALDEREWRSQHETKFRRRPY